MWLAVAWGLSLAQVLVGTQVRGSIEVIRSLMPFVNARVWLSSIGALLYVHTFLGILVIAFGVYIGLTIIICSCNPSSLMWEGAWAILLLMFLDIILGFGFLLIGTPPLMEILHLWVSSFVVGVLSMMYSAAKRKGRVTA
jgi:cytochrome c oxidase assembly protein subunit 15